MKKRFTEEQIIGFIKEAEAGLAVDALCRKPGFGNSTFYKWKATFGGINVSQAKRLKVLEEENGRLKRLLADSLLDNAALKDVVSRKW